MMLLEDLIQVARGEVEADLLLKNARVVNVFSGDIHAANMLKNLLKITDDIEPYAIGGDRLAEAGANLLFHIKDISVKQLKNVKEKVEQNVHFASNKLWGHNNVIN